MVLHRAGLVFTTPHWAAVEPRNFARSFRLICDDNRLSRYRRSNRPGK
jgi:hypothetical protein